MTMASKKVIKEARPQSSPENREQQMIALAVDLAEKQLREGTASPSVINHYLKLGSQREVIERELLAKQAKLMDAKTESITKAKEHETNVTDALNALKSYTPGS